MGVGGGSLPGAWEGGGKIGVAAGRSRLVLVGGFRWGDWTAQHRKVVANDGHAGEPVTGDSLGCKVEM